MPELSQPALMAKMSLEEHPDRNTPALISSSPMSIDQIGPQDILEGLLELQAAGLAEESGGGWRLTPA